MSTTDNKNKNSQDQDQQKVEKAHEQAEKDMHNDPDLNNEPDPAADLDEGELARLEGED